MNILFVCDEYPPGPHGGIGTAVQTLARALVRKGHGVVVAGLYDWGYGQADRECDEGVEVYRIRRGLDGAWARRRDALPVRVLYRVFRRAHLFQWDLSRSLPKFRTALEGIIQKHSIQIAEVSDFQDYVQRLVRPLPFPDLPVPIVVKTHGTNTYFNEEAGNSTPAAIRTTEKSLLVSARLVLGVSRYTVRKTAEIFELTGPTAVAYNGLDLREVPPEPTNRVPGRVVFSGTLVAKKGIYQLIRAWNKVLEVVPGATLHVYGKGPVHSLQALLNPASSPSIVFMGHVGRPELLRALSEASIGVFPSFAETFGMGAVEAMACGAATIYSTRTAGPEVVEDGVDGLLADPDDVDGLARSIIRLLQSPHLCRQFGEAGRLRVAGQFDINVLADAHLAHYRSVLEHTQPPGAAQRNGYEG